jgi:hypothetical protein
MGSRHQTEIYVRKRTLSIITPETIQQLEDEACHLRNHYTGAFKFKSKLEDVVMEHAGIHTSQTEAASKSPESKQAGRRKRDCCRIGS